MSDKTRYPCLGCCMQNCEAGQAYCKLCRPVPERARDTQVGGDHYSKNVIQPWDVIEQYGLNYFSGNVLKYLLRYRDKNGVEDLKKARHYLDKLIEYTGEDES